MAAEIGRRRGVCGRLLDLSSLSKCVWRVGVTANIPVYVDAASCPARGTSGTSGAARRGACGASACAAAPGPPGRRTTEHGAPQRCGLSAACACGRGARCGPRRRPPSRCAMAARRSCRRPAGEAARNHSSAERASRRARSENAERKRAFEHRGRRRGGRRGGPGRPGCAPPPRPAHGDGRPRAACCSERAHQHAGRPIIGVRAVPRNARQGGAGPR